MEHYEIAGYGCVSTYAKRLGEDQAVSLLRQTLREEIEADKKLSQLADRINLKAANSKESDGGSSPVEEGRDGLRSPRLGPIAHAHNIKITQDGKVTLRGPVRSEDEKKNLQAKAVAVAGEENATDQLEIAPSK